MEETEASSLPLSCLKAVYFVANGRSARGRLANDPTWLVAATGATTGVVTTGVVTTGVGAVAAGGVWYPPRQLLALTPS